jgi:hypothetical protein
LVAREQTDKTGGKKHIRHRKLQHCHLLHADDEEHPLNNGLLPGFGQHSKQNAAAIDSLE